MHCIAVRCFALHCLELHCIVSHCSVNCVAIHYILMHYIALYCIACYCILMHCIALYVIVQTPDVNQGLPPVNLFGQFQILFVSKLIHGSDHTNSNTFKDTITLGKIPKKCRFSYSAPKAAAVWIFYKAVWTLNFTCYDIVTRFSKAVLRAFQNNRSGDRNVYVWFCGPCFR